MSLLPVVLSTLLAGAASAAPAEEVSVDLADEQYQRRLVAAMQASDSPRERALSMYVVDLATLNQPQGKRLRDASDAAPADELVQYLWSSLGARDDGCSPPHPCPGRVFALSRLTPENGVAWLAPLAQSANAKDAAGVDTALARIAAAERYDDFFIEGMRAWTRVLDGVPRTAADLGGHRSGLPPENLSLVQATAYAALLPLNGSTTELVRACDRGRNSGASDQHWLDCARAGRLMYRTGTSDVSQRIGFVLVRNSGLETPEDRQARRRDDWRMSAFIGLAESLEHDPAEWRQYFRDLDSTGNEARAQELLLTRRGIALEPAAGWKSSLFR